MRLLRLIIRRLAYLEARFNQLEERMTTDETQQAHLDRDIADIDAKFSDAIQHLKDQIAAGVPAAQLDFSKADALAGKADAEDATDNPPAPVPAAPVDAPVAPTPVDAPVPDGTPIP